jgi:riboflavin synthase alpha subunit
MSISSSTNAAIGSRGKVAIDGVEISLAINNSKNYKIPKLEFILNGVQPTNIMLSNLNEQIGLMTLTVTLKYDDYEIGLDPVAMVNGLKGALKILDSMPKFPQ